MRRSTSDYPASLSDGTLVTTGRATSYEDTGLSTDTTSYYTLWGDDGSPYATFGSGSVSSASATPDPGIATLIWKDSASGLVEQWRLSDSGSCKSTGLVTDISIAAGWRVVGAGYINADSYACVVIHNQNDGRPAWWILDANGAIGRSGFIIEGRISSEWEVATTADVNADGTMDIILHSVTDVRVAFWALRPDGTIGEYGYIDDQGQAPTWQVQGATD